MARTPFLDNQHPRIIYNEQPRTSSKNRINNASVLEKRNKPKKFSICDLFGKKVEAATPAPVAKITPPPSVIKLYNTNPVAVGTVAIQIMLENPNRIGLRITNVGTTTIYIGVGRVPTTTSYDHILPGCTGSANDGTGGVVTDDLYLDGIYALSSGASGSIAIVEKP